MKNKPTLGMANAYAPELASALCEETRALIARRERLLGPAYRLFYREPVHLVRGEGVWLWDAQGKRYLDAYNNVVPAGHCHPRIVAALTQQASVLNTHTRYLHQGILDYAERLLATFPKGLAHLMLTCTGSEANDLALRVAKAYTGADGFIVTDCAYHGVTEAVAQLSPSLGPGVPRGENVRTVPAPESLRSGGDAGHVFAEHVKHAIEDLRAHGRRVAALLCDTIFSSDGVFTEPAGFLASAVNVVHRAGGLFIADEIQAGFGRTGDSMWGFARHGIQPDLVTLGKPMGNGHPVAGVVLRAEVIADFGRKARYFNTFGGNPVTCSVALATLDVVQEEQLQDNAWRVGSYLKDGLTRISRSCPAIREVRGAGLSIGVEFVDSKTQAPVADRTSAIVNALRSNGILISATGPWVNVLKIRPPLIFAKEHADLLLERLSEAIESTRDSRA